MIQEHSGFIPQIKDKVIFTEYGDFVFINKILFDVYLGFIIPKLTFDANSWHFRKYHKCFKPDRYDFQIKVLDDKTR